MNDIKQDLIDDFIRVKKEYEEQGISPQHITRRLYLQKTKYKQDKFEKAFGSFTAFRNKALNLSSYNRFSLDIQKDDTDKPYPRRYFVTSAIAGADLDEPLFNSIQKYCKYQKAELVLLPMRGVENPIIGYNNTVQEFEENFATEYIFNENLKAQDFLIAPQMINPLTGLNRFSQKQFSLIIASPKQFMRSVPVSHESFPHIIQSTGTCTIPSYANTRQGKLSEQDHCRGGLIVEVEDRKIFHVRQVQATSEGGFYDLGLYYCQNKIFKQRASAFIVGDIHSGFEDATALKAWDECIKLINPKYIVLHDIFDGHSISHHHSNNLRLQVNRKQEIDTLEKELINTGETLLQWNKKFPDKELVIVPSNHNEFLNRYLEEGRYVFDRVNYKISLHLSNWLMDNKNPLEEYIKENFDLKNVLWLKREKDYKIHGVHIGAHGDKGSNGFKRGNIQQLELSYGNAVVGHSHAPAILRNVLQVGTSTKLLLDYNIGSPSSWLHASVILYKEGKRQMIVAIDGKWQI